MNTICDNGKETTMNRMLKAASVATTLGAIVLGGQLAIAGPGQDTMSENMGFQLAHSELHHSGGGTGLGMMGQGSGMMMDQGMMGTGIGTAPCGTEKDLTADDVKKVLEGRLAWAGNKRLKVGEVTTKDDETYVATIVTKDNSLVQRLEIDRKTGIARSVE